MIEPSTSTPAAPTPLIAWGREINLTAPVAQPGLVHVRPRHEDLRDDLQEVMVAARASRNPSELQQASIDVYRLWYEHGSYGRDKHAVDVASGELWARGWDVATKLTSGGCVA